MRQVSVSVGVLWVVGVAVVCGIGLAFGAGYEIGYEQGGKGTAAFYNHFLKTHPPEVKR